MLLHSYHTATTLHRRARKILGPAAEETCFKNTDFSKNVIIFLHKMCYLQIFWYTPAQI